eukprot:g3837.t1
MRSVVLFPRRYGWRRRVVLGGNRRVGGQSSVYDRDIAGSARRYQSSTETPVHEDTSSEDTSTDNIVEADIPSLVLDTRHVKCTDIKVNVNNESSSRYVCPSNKWKGGFSDERVPILPYDRSLVELSSTVNKSAVERRSAEISSRRTVKKTWQAAWLLKAVTQIDLTTLAGDDTPGKVGRLCAKAVRPVRRDLLVGDLGLDPDFAETIKCGAVCVYPSRVADAVRALEGTGVPVASVATGFPSGQIKHEHKLEEIQQAVADGASEIDIVINRQAALCGDWETVYRECVDFREACGDAHMKAILAVGELSTLTNIYRASMACMLAGSDFIKTSTGKEKVNAELPNALVMSRAIRDFLQHTGYKVGLKVAGGVNTTKHVLAYQSMVKEELGTEWLEPHLFRIGASSLITDIERQLYHHGTGEYAASYYMPMS